MADDQDQEPKMAKIIQANVNRCRAALDLLYAEAKSTNCAVISVSEPNRQWIKNPSWMTDTQQDAAIMVLPRGPPIIANGSGRGFVWIELPEYVVYSCYISPNVDMDTFRRFLTSLQNDTKRHRKEIIITGDFNSHSTVWGSRKTCERGELVMEWLATDSLVLHNDGVIPTFKRGDIESFIDLTFSSEEISRRISNWKVEVEKENMSDHEWISFSTEAEITRYAGNARTAIKGWKFDPNRLDQFVEELRKTLTDLNLDLDAERFEEIFTNICNRVYDLKKGGNGKKSVYWWTAEISQSRKLCLKHKRKLVRGNDNQNLTDEDRQTLRQNYVEARRRLRTAIKLEKDRAWNEILEDLDNDVWGLGYKIVLRKLKFANTPSLTTQQQVEIANSLFPTHEKTEWPRVDIAGPIQLFTDKEVLEAASMLRSGKAPGPDGVPAELIKAAIRSDPKPFTAMMNRYLADGIFPDKWKIARLILLEKPKKPGQKTGYRPICLLNVAGKLLERLLLTRLEAEGGTMSDRQYGFRKGRSTVKAIQRVLEIGKRAARGAYQHRKICALIALDVKNAFNSAPWSVIVEALRKKNTPQYLVRMIQNYFTNRWIDVDGEKVQVTCGVPQGSILGPYLWNVFYDDVLKMYMPAGVELVAFADDLAIVVFAKTQANVESLANSTLERVRRKMESMGLELAPEKSEAVLLYTRRATPSMEFQLGDTKISTRSSIKYLGVWLQKNMAWKTHIAKVAEKAEKTLRSLGQLMPNIRGPRASKRRTLASVVTSTILYAAPVWESVLQVGKYRKILDGVMRRGNLRICSAYRTAPSAAIEVISGIPPIHLQVAERTRADLTTDKGEAKRWMEDRWQEEWRDPTAITAKWTRRLIPDVRLWKNRKHGEVNFHLTQFLTGHGVFGNYFLRFNLDVSDACWFCGIPDSPAHTIFDCERWEEDRIRTNAAVGITLTPDNICETMLDCKGNWGTVANYIVGVMRKKEDHERALGR